MNINILSPKEILDHLLEGNTLSADYLDKFLQKNPEEGQYLDYKDGAITSPKERKNGRKTIREYINGFANSDGGILIIGVGRRTHREIKGCTPPGREPLDKWAENCVLDMSPYFSPQPRFQVVDHPKGKVLLIAVARAISLVPCVESRRMKYFLRINQTTLEAPEYLISDLVLGKRQHPFLDLHYVDMDEPRSEYLKPSRDEYIPTRDVTFAFLVENMSLLTASDIKLGIISWSLTDQEKNINRFLLSYVDIVNINESIFKSYLHLIHDSTKKKTGDVTDIDTFKQSKFKLPLLRFPLIHAGKANCAIYIISKGAPPTWFQLEYTYGSGRDGSVRLTRMSSGRPKVSWEG